MTDISPEKALRLRRDGKINYLKSGQAHLDPNNASLEAGETIHYFGPQPAHALILYPSFGCPAIIAPNQELTVFLLMAEDLASYDNIGPPVAGPDSPSLYFLARLQAQLQWSHWRDRKRLKKDYKHNKATRYRFYNGSNEASWPHFRANSPQHIQAERELLLQTADGGVVGRVSPSMVNQYLTAGFQYLVRLTYREHGLKAGLHNLTWLSLKPSIGLSIDTSTHALFEEPQDRLIREGLTACNTKLHHGFSISDEGPFQFKIDEDDPIHSYHPVYVTDVDYLGIGHLTDVHICSRHELFKKCELQLIPGAPHDISPPLGSLVNSSFDAFKDLLDQMGQDSQVDVVAITGDLVDYAYGLNLAYAEDSEIETWEILHLAKLKKQPAYTGIFSHHERAKTLTVKPNNNLELIYTPGIDSTIFYSLTKYFLDRYQKPILITSGNHDAYTYPYGISPRLGKNLSSWLNEHGVPRSVTLPHQDKLRANAGIPMDHNLTTPEAMFLYGPGYGDILKLSNFDHKIFDLFSQILTPLTDFSLTYKKQTITGLEWGEDESGYWYYATQSYFGGSLPRATGGLTNIQILILEQIVKKHEPSANRYHIMLTHAPVLCFGPGMRLCPKNEDSVKHFYEIESLTIARKATPVDVGSFNPNKWKFFEKFVFTNKITHVLSGHSHRAALYSCASYCKEDYLHQMHVMACPHPSANAQRVALTNLVPAPREDLSSTRFIVSSSAGPMGTNNYRGEYAGYGMEAPSGSILTFDTQDDYLQSISSRTKKPRFATVIENYMANHSRYDDLIIKAYVTNHQPMTLEVSLGKHFVTEQIESITLMLLDVAPHTLKLLTFEKLSLSQGTYKHTSKWVGDCSKNNKTKGAELNLRDQYTDVYLVVRCRAVHHLKNTWYYDYKDPWIMKLSVIHNHSHIRNYSRLPIPPINKRGVTIFALDGDEYGMQSSLKAGKSHDKA